MQDFLREIEETWLKVAPSWVDVGRSRSKLDGVRDPASGWLPALDQHFGESVSPGSRAVDRRTRRQVGIKLAASDFADLSTAARRCGVTPTTLARMFVIRGIRATLRAAWDEDR